MSAYPDYVHQTLARTRDEGQMSQLNLSARAYHRTRSVKLARTIAHLAEALQYRPKIMLG